MSDDANPPVLLRVDPERLGQYGDTGIKVRALGPDDTWGTFDYVDLDQRSLRVFVASRGHVSTWAMALLERMLGHDPNMIIEPISSPEDAPVDGPG